MRGSLFWMGCVLMVGVLAGCEADQSVVGESNVGYIDADGHPVGTPYWWRTHPFFKDIEVDEAATLATGDPYLVIHAESPSMYELLAEALKEEYSKDEVLHLLFHHRDKVLAMKVPSVDMALLEREIPPPEPGATRHDPCECPWEGGVCETGGGGPPPPPPLPPDPHTNTFMHVFGDYVEEEDLPAPRKVRLYLSTISKNRVKMLFSRLKNITVRKDAVPIFEQALDQRNFTTVHEFKEIFSYGDAHRVAWVTTAEHEVSNTLWVIWRGNSRADIIY